MATKIQSVKDRKNRKNNFSISLEHQESMKTIVKKVHIYRTLNVEEREGTLYKTSLEAVDQHFCIKKYYL